MILFMTPETTLLKDAKKIGLDTMNGLEMNLLQAVLAFKHVNHTTLSLKEVKAVMEL